MIHLSQTNTKGFDELVFDHRNQAYGAYVLRREYPRQVLKSLLIGIAIIASILAIPYLANLLRREVKIDPTVVDRGPVIIQEITPDDPIQEPQKPKDPLPSGNNIIFTIPIVTIDFVQDTMTTTEDFDNFNPSNFNSHGNGWEFIGGGGNDDGELIGDFEEIPDAVSIQDPPSFPGGDEAMRIFLSENLQYPQHARDIGLEGKVYVTFVVDQFGNLVNIQTPRPIGGGLDEEAVRVIKKMPRWKPGRQNGYPVKVRFNFPIVFKLN